MNQFINDHPYLFSLISFCTVYMVTSSAVRIAAMFAIKRSVSDE